MLLLIHISLMEFILYNFYIHMSIKTYGYPAISFVHHSVHTFFFENFSLKYFTFYSQLMIFGWIFLLKNFWHLKNFYDGLLFQMNFVVSHYVQKLKMPILNAIIEG